MDQAMDIDGPGSKEARRERCTSYLASVRVEGGAGMYSDCQLYGESISKRARDRHRCRPLD